VSSVRRGGRTLAIAATVFAAVVLSAPRASAARASAVRASVVQPPRGTVKTDTLWAQSLGTTKALTIYLPPSYGSGNTRYPLLVYLHGGSGNERDWVQQGRLDRVMDSLIAAGAPEAIIVMPDGDNGYYTTSARLPDVPACQADTVLRGGESADSYCVPWPHYDDYIARDIVGYMDRRYRTRASRESRGIAGLSMGGYGAVTLALAYPDVFSAAASHSGALSLRMREGASPDDPLRYRQTRDEIAAHMRQSRYRVAVFGTDSIAVLARDPVVMAERFARRARAGEVRWPKLALDVGTEDRLLAQSRDFHAVLTRLGVPHTYAEYPGAHTWGYWRARLPQSLGFLLGVVR
jgi:enterochelin esterase-like enzyme